MLTSAWKSSQTSASSVSTRVMRSGYPRSWTLTPRDRVQAPKIYRSEAEQAVEEVAVPAHRHPQFLGVLQLGALPAVQLGAVPGQRVGQPLADVPGEGLRLLGGVARVVDEAELDLLPAVAVAVHDLGLPEHEAGGRRYLTGSQLLGLRGGFRRGLGFGVLLLGTVFPEALFLGTLRLADVVRAGRGGGHHVRVVRPV